MRCKAREAPLNKLADDVRQFLVRELEKKESELRDAIDRRAGAGRTRLHFVDFPRNERLSKAFHALVAPLETATREDRQHVLDRVSKWFDRSKEWGSCTLDYEVLEIGSPLWSLCWQQGT